MRHDGRRDDLPLVADLYGTLIAARAGLGRAQEAALAALVASRAAVEGAAASGSTRRWLLRQLHEGTMAWVLVAVLLLLGAGLLGLLARLART